MRLFCTTTPDGERRTAVLPGCAVPCARKSRVYAALICERGFCCCRACASPRVCGNAKNPVLGIRVCTAKHKCGSGGSWASSRAAAAAAQRTNDFDGRCVLHQLRYDGSIVYVQHGIYVCACLWMRWRRMRTVCVCGRSAIGGAFGEAHFVQVGGIFNVPCALADGIERSLRCSIQLACSPALTVWLSTSRLINIKQRNTITILPGPVGTESTHTHGQHFKS